MKQFVNTTLLATVIAVVFNLSSINAIPFTIDDNRVRTLDSSPVLGRGYIIGTNSYQSNCLIVDEHSTPSYNYDYSFIDMTQSTDIDTELTGKLSSSFSYNAIKSEAVAIESDSDSELFLAVSNMRIDRSFSGFKEEASSIMNDAKELLQHQDYIGFFKSCGTNYVRSIRRAQEITAIFKFSSPSRDLAQEFAAKIKTQGGAPAIDESIFYQEKFSTIKQNLEVKILAYGLGLNTKGESAIVSTSVKNYNEVIEFAFRSFTQGTDSSNVGMVYALEFVPWVDNPSFQHASKMFDEDIELPLSRSLIPKAIADDGVLSFVNNNSIRSQFSCKHLYFSIDKFGYCCDAAELFDQERGLYETEVLDIESSSRICKPNRKLEKSVIKNTMSNNGEFVARLELTVQKKINQLFTLEKCVASVNSMLEKYDSYTLKSQGSAKYDSSVEGKFTVNQLKMTLDPLGDLSLIKHMGNELDEFINMYYQPCIAALFGTSVGSSPDIEAKYFMAYGWLTHEACSKLSCLADNMRWNRNGSGCIGSLITGRKAPIYDVNDIACEKNDEGNPSDGSELCKYNTTDLQLYQTKLNTCWDDPNPTSRVPYYILEHFCMPEIIGEKIDEDVIHPCQFITNDIIITNPPCHGISLVLSNDNINAKLSENSSNKTIVKCFDTSEVTNMDNFLRESNINADLSSWDVSSVTTMQYMYFSADAFNGDISSWDVSSVTNMEAMFHKADKFDNYISDWDVSSVTNMFRMFNEARIFNNDISSWDVSSVEKMNYMFNKANAFDSDISGWDVSSVTHMFGMFEQAKIFNNDISSWDVSSVKNMQYMFYQAHVFDSDISGWDVSSVTEMESMFMNAYAFDSDISDWDVSSVTRTQRMFQQARVFDSDISGWDVSSVKNMQGMFNTAKIFNSDISGWDVSSVTIMEAMFKEAHAFDSGISGWDVSSVTSMNGMFDKAKIFNNDISSWDVSSVTNMQWMFNQASMYAQRMCEWTLPPSNTGNMFSNSKCTKVECVDCPSSNGPCHGISLVLTNDDKGTILSENSSNKNIVKCFDTSEVTNMENFLRYSNINADLSSWDVSSVTTMKYMFNNAHAFDSDISGWDVSSVTDMFEMFAVAKNFNNDISGWDVSSVTVMAAMFYQAHVFDIDISGWDVSSVRNMEFMFFQAHVFDSDISSWDVSSVTFMVSMFNQARIFNDDISNWDVSSVRNMVAMFKEAHAFDSDLSGWDVSSVTSMNGMFDKARIFNNDISSWDVSAVTNMQWMFFGAEQYAQRMCEWTLPPSNTGNMFSNSKCTKVECVDCPSRVLREII